MMSYGLTDGGRQNTQKGRRRKSLAAVVTVKAIWGPLVFDLIIQDGWVIKASLSSEWRTETKNHHANFQL